MEAIGGKGAALSHRHHAKSPEVQCRVRHDNDRVLFNNNVENVEEAFHNGSQPDHIQLNTMCAFIEESWEHDIFSRDLKNGMIPKKGTLLGYGNWRSI